MHAENREEHAPALSPRRSETDRGGNHAAVADRRKIHGLLVGKVLIEQRIGDFAAGSVVDLESEGSDADPVQTDRQRKKGALLLRCDGKGEGILRTLNRIRCAVRVPVRDGLAFPVLPEPRKVEGGFKAAAHRAAAVGDDRFRGGESLPEHRNPALFHGVIRRLAEGFLPHPAEHRRLGPVGWNGTFDPGEIVGSGVVVLLIRHLRAQPGDIGVVRGGAPHLPVLFAALDRHAVPVRRADHPRQIMEAVLEGSDPGIVCLHGDPVVSFPQDGAQIHFVVGPRLLVAARRSAADVTPVDIQTVKLVRTDQKRRLLRNFLQFKVIAELRIAVVQIEIPFRPDPAGTGEQG